MTKIRDEFYRQVFKKHAVVHKALAHTKRLEIVHLLRDHELSVHEIAEMLGLPQANLSQHLTVLRQAGLVKTRKNGVTVHYGLSHPKIIEASDMVRAALMAKIEEEQRLAAIDLSQVLQVYQDPVCKMHLTSHTASDKVEYQGQTYYFCASGCKKRFLHGPKKFLSK